MVAEKVITRRDAFEISTIEYDAWQSAAIVNNLTSHGLALNKFRQSYERMSPAAKHLERLIIGSIGAAAHFCMVRAFAEEQASFLAPFNYSKLIWVMILGYLVFDDLPGLNMLIGSTIIFAAGLYVLYRENNHLLAASE
jgi:drug/metabolite transporter (DMT)-like permease